jgi:hypothetical protein
MSKQPITPPESLLDIIGILYRWRKRIALFVIVVTLLTAGVSLLMPNYYASHATFFPVSEKSTSHEALFGGESPSIIGASDEVERMMTFAMSRDLYDYLIKEFNLYEHYDIDSTSARGLDKVRKKLMSHYKLLKNEYGAIELSIEDKDILYPYEMINKAMERIDYMYKSALNHKKIQAIKSFETIIAERQAYQNRLMDTLNYLREEYGIIDVVGQGEALSSLSLSTESDLTEAIASFESMKASPDIPRDTLAIFEAKVSGLKKKYESLVSPQSTSSYSTSRYKKGREIFVKNEQLLFSVVAELNQYTNHYNRLRASLNLEESYLIVSERPMQPRMKSRPKRSLYVIGAFMASFFLALVAAILFESYKNVSWKEVFKGD